MHAIIRVVCALKKIKPVKRINDDVVGAGLFSYNMMTLDSRDLKKVSEPCVLVMGFTLKNNKTVWLFCGQRCGEGVIEVRRRKSKKLVRGILHESIKSSWTRVVAVKGVKYHCMEQCFECGSQWDLLMAVNLEVISYETSNKVLTSNDIELDKLPTERM